MRCRYQSPVRAHRGSPLLFRASIGLNTENSAWAPNVFSKEGMTPKEPWARWPQPIQNACALASRFFNRPNSKATSDLPSSH